MHFTRQVRTSYLQGAWFYVCVCVRNVFYFQEHQVVKSAILLRGNGGNAYYEKHKEQNDLPNIQGPDKQTPPGTFSYLPILHVSVTQSFFTFI